MVRKRLRFLGVLGALCLSFLPAGTRAEGVEVQPITLKLSATALSTMLSVTNRTQEALRFHISAVAWTQDKQGEMALAPTKDLIFFPAMLTLNPQEARNLRIGLKAKPGAVERTYRVIVEQLPGLVTASQGAGAAASIGMVTRMSIPVFLEPPSPQAKASVTGFAVSGSEVRFAIKNSGNAHYRPHTVELKARTGATLLHTESLSSWYVLAGGTLEYTYKLPTDVCVAAKSLDLELNNDNGTTRATLADVHCTP